MPRAQQFQQMSGRSTEGFPCSATGEALESDLARTKPLDHDGPMWNYESKGMLMLNRRRRSSRRSSSTASVVETEAGDYWSDDDDENDEVVDCNEEEGDEEYGCPRLSSMPLSSRPRLCQVCARLPAHCTAPAAEIAFRTAASARRKNQTSSSWVVTLERLAVDMSEPDSLNHVIVKRKSHLMIWLMVMSAASVTCPFLLVLGRIELFILPLSYMVLTTGAVVAAVMRRRYRLFEDTNMVMLASVSFLAAVVGGGVVESGGMVVWMHCTPFLSAMFHPPEKALRWLGAFAAAFLLYVAFEYVGPGTLSHGAIWQLVMNHLAVQTILFASARLFSSKTDEHIRQSERLLSNMLPLAVARRLKRGESNIVDHYQSVTVIFVDLVGFTRASSIMDANLLVGGVLRDVFSAFDELTEQYCVDKIKTIGDAYMAVGGLRTEDDSDHVVRVMKLAVCFQEALKIVNSRHGSTFEIRIGVHSGPVIGGVLGTQKFSFDVWGNTVNVASRMESTGVPGFIHITTNTYSLIKDEPSFRCTYRGSMEVKGKGDLETFLVQGVTVRPHESVPIRINIPDNTAASRLNRGNASTTTSKVRQVDRKRDSTCGLGRTSSLSQLVKFAINTGKAHAFSEVEPKEHEWYNLQDVYVAAKRLAPIGMAHDRLVRQACYLLFRRVIFGCKILQSVIYMALGLPEISCVLLTIVGAFGGITTVNEIHRGDYDKTYAPVPVLIFPVALTIYLGGLVESGGFIIWVLCAPVGVALVRNATRMGVLWQSIYVFDVIISALAEKYFLIRSALSDWQLIMMTWSYAVVGCILFTGTLTFAKQFASEFKKCESLLLNILPASIAGRLKGGESNIIERHESVTILFADLVGFTRASSVMDPELLFCRVLRDLFSTIDSLVERRKLEKIKTIGDAYMVVGGLGDCDSSTDHVREVVLLAFELQEALGEVNMQHGTDFDIRIGVHTGPVIAGVLGMKKFSFDVWGDAVNVASRMESHGKPGTVHISPETYHEIRDMNCFKCESNGIKQVKGKGFMETYTVLREESCRWCSFCCRAAD